MNNNKINEIYIDMLQHIVDRNAHGGLRLDHIDNTSMCLELMIGEVELGDDNNVYAYVCETPEHAAIVGEQFMKCTNERVEDVVITQSSTGYVSTRGQRFLFMDVNHVDDIRGVSLNRLFMDLSARTRHQIMAGHEHPFYTAVIPSLLPDGDVV